MIPKIKIYDLSDAAMRRIYYSQWSFRQRRKRKEEKRLPGLHKTRELLNGADWI